LHRSHLKVFNELDHNKDSYITFEDIHFVLPHLTFHLDEEIIRAAIHTIDTDHDNDRLSYFDFVTSLIALEECKLTMKRKTTMGIAHEINKKNDKAFNLI
jgi:Ca2+-binding EF-hand superfamily protein